MNSLVGKTTYLPKKRYVLLYLIIIVLFLLCAYVVVEANCQELRKWIITNLLIV